MAFCLRESFKDCIKDITKCPICLEICADPRSLPCLHTFCLKCVKRQYECLCPGDEVGCPVCRKEHPIPDNGAEGLQHNFFVEALIDGAKSCLRTSELNSESDTKCEGCGEDTGHTATVYCRQCDEKLCEICKKRCLRKKYGIHDIVTLEEKVSYSMLRGSFCEQHNELLKMYCTECKTNICTICFAIKHTPHRCLEINDVARELSVQIQNGVRRLAIVTADIHTEIGIVEKVKREFVAKANKVQMHIKRKGEELKILIDGRVEELLQEVQDTKQKNEKEIDTFADKLDLELVAVNSLMNYSEMLMAKGTPCDITRSANDVVSRVAVLEHDWASTEPCCAPEITFKPVDFSNVLTKVGGWDQFFGDVIVKATQDDRPYLRTTVHADGVTGVALCDNKIFVVSQERDAILVFGADNGEQLSEIMIPDFSVDFNVITDIVVCNESKCLYVGQTDNGYRDITFGAETSTYNKPKASEIVWRASIDGDIQKWLPILPFYHVSLSAKSDRLLITCGTNNNNSSSSCKLLIYGADARELKRISPIGITELHHAVETSFETLIVCHSKPQPQVSEIDFRGQVIRVYNGSRQLNFPRYLALDPDGRVFVADYDSDCILILNHWLVLDSVLLDKNPPRLSDHPVNVCYEKQSRSDMIVVGSCWSGSVQVYKIPKSSKLTESTYEWLPTCSGQSADYHEYAALPTSGTNFLPQLPYPRPLKLPARRLLMEHRLQIPLSVTEESSTNDDEVYRSLEDDFDPYTLVLRDENDDCEDEDDSEKIAAAQDSPTPAVAAEMSQVKADEDNPHPVKHKFRLKHLFVRRPKRPK